MSPADPGDYSPRGALRLGKLCRGVEAPHTDAKSTAVARRQAVPQADAREYEERMRLHNHQLAVAAHQARWRVVQDERSRIARKAEEAATARRRKASEAAQKRIVEAHRKMADSFHQGLETSRKAKPAPSAAFNTPRGRFEYAQLRTKSSPRYLSPRSSTYAAEAEARTPRKPLFAPPSPITTEEAAAE